MALLPFIIASAVGRGARFFLVAGLLYWGGSRITPILESKMDHIAWGTITVAIIAYLLFGRG